MNCMRYDATPNIPGFCQNMFKKDLPFQSVRFFFQSIEKTPKHEATFITVDFRQAVGVASYLIQFISHTLNYHISYILKPTFISHTKYILRVQYLIHLLRFMRSMFISHTTKVNSIFNQIQQSLDLVKVNIVERCRLYQEPDFSQVLEVSQVG